MSENIKVVPLTCHGHSRPVTHLSFSSVVDDGKFYLLSACKDNNPMLRDGLTGDWIGTFIGHKGAVWQARLSTDGTLAATASADFSAKVWDTTTGDALHTLQHNHIVRAVAFPGQPRPPILATGGAEKKLRIFDLSSSSTASSPNGQTNGTDGATNAPSYEVGPGVHGGTIKSIIWGKDLNTLITAADDKKIRWWDLRDRRPIGEYTVQGEVGSCELDTSGGNFSWPENDETVSDGVLSVAAGKSVYFFHGKQPGTLIKTVETKNQVASVAFHAGARRFVTGGGIGDTWVRVWDFDEEKELGKCHQMGS